MAASLVVLAAGAAVVLFFTAEVCDQQLASNGTVVRVCRHPQMTDPPMVVTGLVILVLLCQKRIVSGMTAGAVKG